MCRRIASKPNWSRRQSLSGANGRSTAAPAGVLSVQIVSWVLDADVLSYAKRHGDARVTAWPSLTGRLLHQRGGPGATCLLGAQQEGRQRQAWQAWLTRLMAALHGRILSFNASVAYVWAEQQRELERAGRRMPIEDSYIAATARWYTLPSSPATTNTFADLA